MNPEDVKKKLVFPSNRIPDFEIKVEDIIYSNNSGKFVISDEYYYSLKFNNDYIINNKDYINFNIIN